LTQTPEPPESPGRFISDTELTALIAATYGVPQTAPGLLARIDSAAELELNRRRDFDCPLQPPEAAIDPSEDEVSINAAMVLRDQFAQDSPAVLAFFDALVELLTGGGRKQQRRPRRSTQVRLFRGSGYPRHVQRLDRGASAWSAGQIA
jgi:hypothetical protein